MLNCTVEILEDIGHGCIKVRSLDDGTEFLARDPHGLCQEISGDKLAAVTTINRVPTITMVTIDL